MFFEICFCLTIHSALSIEEPVREQYLKPRHYNPHPFQNNPSRRSQKVGPVLFNYNREGSADVDNRFITLSRTNQIQDVPYQKVVRKYKKKKIGRFDPEDEKINPRLEQALAKHGAKVLKLPPEKLAKDHIPFVRDIHKRHPNYAFSYKVLDHSSGDDFSHSQVQDSEATNGEYRVKLPDGRLQIVSYTADQNGYKADVKYTESADNSNRNAAGRKFYHQDPVYHIERLPVRELGTVKANKKQQIDYYDEVQPSGHRHEVVKLKTMVPTEIPGSYDGYDGGYENIVVTPSPGYSNGAAVSANANYQLPLPLNVQIFTTNARDYHHSAGSYIPVIASTPHTYHSKNINHYRQNLISPQIINNGDQGIVLPLSTPSSFVLTDQNGQVIDNIKLVTSTAVPYVLSTTPSPLNYVTIHSTGASPIRYK